MKREPKLSYSQLRQILCLTISNATLKAKLEDFLSGKVAKVSEVELLELISQSEADKELIRIISNQDPDDMDALEARERICSPILVCSDSYECVLSSMVVFFFIYVPEFYPSIGLVKDA